MVAAAHLMDKPLQEYRGREKAPLSTLTPPPTTTRAPLFVTFYDLEDDPRHPNDTQGGHYFDALLYDVAWERNAMRAAAAAKHRSVRIRCAYCVTALGRGNDCDTHRATQCYPDRV